MCRKSPLAGWSGARSAMASFITAEQFPKPSCPGSVRLSCTCVLWPGAVGPCAVFAVRRAQSGVPANGNRNPTADARNRLIRLNVCSETKRPTTATENRPRLLGSQALDSTRTACVVFRCMDSNASGNWQHEAVVSGERPALAACRRQPGPSQLQRRSRLCVALSSMFGGSRCSCSSSCWQRSTRIAPRTGCPTSPCMTRSVRRAAAAAVCVRCLSVWPRPL